MPQKNTDSGDLNRVLIRGVEYPWKEKEPFVDSGMSVQGALEVDPESGSLKCHECGQWQDFLGSHLKAHALTAREYKIRHGLLLLTPLASNTTRAKLRSNSQKANPFRQGPDVRRSAGNLRGYKFIRPLRYELRNERGSCMAQTLAKLRKLANHVGHWPSKGDLRSAGFNISGILNLFGVSDMKSLWSTVDLAYGPTLLQASKMAGLDGFRREYLIELLRDFKPRYGRYPSRKDMSTLLPGRDIYNSMFGCFENAIAEAGLDKALKTA